MELEVFHLFCKHKNTPTLRSVLFLVFTNQKPNFEWVFGSDCRVAEPYLLVVVIVVVVLYWFRGLVVVAWLLKSSPSPLSLSPVITIVIESQRGIVTREFHSGSFWSSKLSSIDRWQSQCKERVCNPVHFVGKNRGFLLPWPSNHFWSCYICSWNTSILITQWFVCSKKMWTCHLVGGLEHDFYDFPFSCEVHHPNCHRIGWWENLQENPSNLMVKTMVSG